MRVFHQRNARSAKAYYAAGEYYDLGAGSLKGRWFGRGAAALGLSGEVDQRSFEQLCDNVNPRTGERLTQRTRSDRRILADLTFSAPKSVSIVWGVTQDERLLDAVRDAAMETFVDVEQDALTRVNHARGVLTTRKTRNVVGAAWVHTTSRPVGDHPDPQLHVHGAILNATLAGRGPGAGSEPGAGPDRWTAVDLSAIVRDSGYYEALFQSRLAEKVRDLGYATERTRHNFEIAGVSRPLVEKFSRRTAEIDETAERLGVRTAEGKDTLGATTRQNKSESLIPPEELPSRWRGRLTEAETNELRDVVMGNVAPSEGPTTSMAVEQATAHHFERESVVRKRELVRDAILGGIARHGPDEVRSEIDRRDWIAEGEEEHELVTTRAVLGEERAVLAFARRGRGTRSPLAAGHEIKRDWLSDEQQAAVDGLLNSTDRVQILLGAAGVGKTSLMKEAIEAVEERGTHVTILAPTAEAAHGVLRDQEGFDANTLAAFLVDEHEHEKARGGLIWIDEAGLVSMPDMHRLFRVADELDARIVLGGDTQQHQAVGRGAALRLLETESGIVPHRVRTIRRQQDDAYREAVMDLSRGDVESGFDRLRDLEAVHEIADDDERNRAIAVNYADALERGESTLVVAPSHAERDAINGAIRGELRDRGLLKGEDHELTVLRSKRLTEGQRADFLQYEAGDVVEFHRRAKGGWKSGERATVLRVHDGRVTTSRNGTVAELPLDAAAAFDVYRPVRERFAVGETLRVTKNLTANRDPRTGRMNNGALVTLQGFTKDGRLAIGNGKSIDPEWGHVEHGSTVTSYASQGKTVDRVILAQSTLSFPASSPEQAYVSLSRARHHVDLFTDDEAALRQAVTRDRRSRFASELAPDEQADPTREEARRKSKIAETARRFVAERLQRLGEWFQHRPLEPAR